MKVKKIVTTGLLGLMIACTFVQTGMFVKANNYTDKVFNFSFIADGSDIAPETPRQKMLLQVHVLFTSFIPRYQYSF